jgi:hypothetical protein
MDITVVAVGRIGEKSIASGIDWFQNSTETVLPAAYYRGT